MSRVQTERAILSNSAGAFLGGLSGGPWAPPDSFMGSSIHGAFYGAGSVGRFLGTNMFGGIGASGGFVKGALTGPFHLARDWWRWRRKNVTQLRRAQSLADEMSFYNPHSSSLDSIFGGREGAAFRAQYGREYNYEAPKGLKGRIDRLIEGPYKPRKFASRLAGDHIVQGVRNYSKLLLSPTNWGIHLAFAGLTSNDNLLDPKDGFAKAFAESVLGEAGLMVGSSLGAAAGAAFAGGGLLFAGAGLLIGGYAGAAIASAIPGAIASYSDWGNMNGRHGRPFRSNLIDSERASTMRQRGLQAIYRSQMNARSALGNEALAYHG